MLESSIPVAIVVALALVFIGLLAAIVRLALGPSLADRVVALDFISVALVGLSALLAIMYDKTEYLDVGIPVALAGFLSAVALARFGERRAAEKRAEDPNLEVRRLGDGPSSWQVRHRDDST